MSKWLSFETKDLEELDNALSFVTQGPRVVALRRKIARARKHITVSSAKAKGRGLQQWVCQQIADITGFAYTPGDDDSPIRSREMGQPGGDVVLAPAVRAVFPFSVECKSAESLSLQEAIGQAQSNQMPGTDWLVVHRRRSLTMDIVILSWEAFAGLLHRAGRK